MIPHTDLGQWAARAVAGALRPSAAAELERFHPGQTPQAAVEESLLGDNWQSRTVPFWRVTGPQLTASLMTLVDLLDEDHASHLVGAALHALILAKQDTAPDAVLRLAERAACWDDGRRAATLSYAGGSVTP